MQRTMMQAIDVDCRMTIVDRGGALRFAPAPQNYTTCLKVAK